MTDRARADYEKKLRGRDVGEGPEANRKERMERLLELVRTRYRAQARFTVEQIVVSGILQWTYQIQIPIFC